MDIMHSELVSGERLQTLADVIVGPGNTETVKTPLTNPLFCTPGGRLPVIYAHTHNTADLINWVNKYNKPCVVMTHNSDWRLTQRQEEIDKRNGYPLYDIPWNIVHWYAQNLEVDFHRMTTLPIGLENSYCFPYDKMQMLLEEKARRREKKGLVYLNCNPNTNKEIRLPIYEYFAKQPWCTVEYGMNGQDYEHYLKQVASHEFVLSPEGNGLDCHRTWEALYLKSKPVIFYRDRLKKFIKDFNNLVVVGYITKLTEEGFINVSSTMQPKNIEKLTMSYWKKQIHGHQ